MNDQTLWILDLVFAIGTLFVLSVAVGVEWHSLSRTWRRVLVVVLAQQAAIAYGAVESWSLEVPAGARVYVLIASLIALTISAGLVLWDRSRRHVPTPGRRVRR